MNRVTKRYEAVASRNAYHTSLTPEIPQKEFSLIIEKIVTDDFFKERGEWKLRNSTTNPKITYGISYYEASLIK